MRQILIKNLVRQLKEIQEGSLWFDQCFKDKIGSLSDTEAMTRPILQVHSVAEHVSHMLEWRKECLIRFDGLRTELMDSPADWKTNEELNKTGWTQLKDDFYGSQSELVDLLETKDDSFLETKFLDTDYNFHYLIEGIIHHDLYHLGQIGISIKLLKTTKSNL